MIVYVILGIVLLAIVFAGIIDWRRKKRRDTAQQSINSHAKKGETSNYTGGGHGGSGEGF